ncbi:MAG: ABC transporter ATP-binding protein [Bacteroidetes bacterium]|nr:ABC transporter ATP-binding protein [Bacteroidota bacterium]
MSNIVIKAENISKNYRLGVLGSRTLKEDLRNWWTKKSFDDNQPEGSPYAYSKEYIWALKNINFEVAHGEVLGFIGRNGAGKSTLLKIISRITLPTTGHIVGKGRTASLLEVGTGFHGELTGRENIFLNGHILGMKKKEIEKKFDEIVDFSGIEQFLDTPVKRYSSGMYVRLAFAVAAHLDPEILIVDEVLAVGDAEFQRKCIGKMKEVSSQKGKTILFVSHNMQALRNLCHRAIVLNKGQIINEGNPETVITSYLKSETTQYLQQSFDDSLSAPGNEFIRIKKVELVPEYIGEYDIIDIRTPLTVNFEFWYNMEEEDGLIVGVHLFDFNGDCIFDIASPNTSFKKGLIAGQCKIPGNFLNDGAYYISIVFVKNITQRMYYYESCLSFDVEDYRPPNAGWYGKWLGYVRPDFPVVLQSKEI